MGVRFFNLAKLTSEHQTELAKAINDVLNRADFILGKSVKTFENEFASWLGPDLSCAGCANGTDAILLAAKSLALPPGSIAVAPAMTFVATIEALQLAGLQVKLIDIDPNTGLMDLNQLERSLDDKVKLVVPVHLYGQMVAMDRVHSLAKAHGCRILEDASQAHGATWKKMPVGHWSDAATFSFYPAKNLGAFGDAGAVVSRDKSLIDKIRVLGDHGSPRKYEHEFPGFNSRLDTLQAAILSVKLKHLKNWNAKRQQIAGWYREGLKAQSPVELLDTHPEAHHVYHQFVVKVSNRDKFRKHLQERDIETGIHYPWTIPQTKAFRSNERFPAAEDLAARCVSLPMCPTLTESDIAEVISAIRAF